MSIINDCPLTKREPDPVERILLSWALRVREDYSMSDEARAVLAACLKQMEEAYIGPDPMEAQPEIVGRNAEDGCDPGAPIYRRVPVPEGCEGCAGCPDCLTNKA